MKENENKIMRCEQKFMNFIKEYFKKTAHLYMWMYKLYACSCCKKCNKKEKLLFLYLYLKTSRLRALTAYYVHLRRKKLAILLFCSFATHTMQ